jgi:hypothetical protein
LAHANEIVSDPISCGLRTIAKAIQAEVRRVDGLGLDLKVPPEANGLKTDFSVSELQFSSAEIKERAKAIKFANCLPESLLLQIIRNRQFE